MSHIVITGANRGIGLEIAKQLKTRGDEVTAVVRKASSELQALEIRIESDIDVSADGPEEVAKRLAGVEIDILINNAGILQTTTLDDLMLDSVRKQFEVNSLGPLRMTAALRKNLKSGSKVAIVSSRMGSITDNNSGGSYGYRMSKAAANAAGKSLSADLKGDGIAVALLHPGWVQTELTGGSGNFTAAESAGLLIERIDQLTLETSGTFWHANGETLPW